MRLYIMYVNLGTALMRTSVALAVVRVRVSVRFAAWAGAAAA